MPSVTLKGVVCSTLNETHTHTGGVLRESLGRKLFPSQPGFDIHHFLGNSNDPDELAVSRNVENQVPPRVTRRPFRYFWSKPAIITGHGGRRNRTLHNGSDDYDERLGVGKPRVGRVETERAGTGGTNREKEKKKEKEKAEIWCPMPPDCQSYPNRAHPLCRDKMSLFCFFSLLVLSTTWHDFIGLFLSLQKSTLISHRAQGIRIYNKPQPLCNLTFYLYSTLSSEANDEEGFLS